MLVKKTIQGAILASILAGGAAHANAFAFPLIPIGVKAGVGGMAMLYSTVTGMYIMSAATAAYYAGAATFTVFGTVCLVSDYLDEEGKPLKEKSE